jgi:Tfp pilus assembly PilM family ATPase
MAALDLSGSRVAGVRVEMRAGRPVIAAHAVEPLPPGALVPALNAANVHDRAVVSAAVGRVLQEIGRPRRVGVVVSDPVAKVSLVRLEQVPSRAQDLDQVIRWQVRKTAPFPIDDAQVGYSRGASSGEGQDFIVTLARRDVVEEYEGLCAASGAHAGLVDLSTFNVANAVMAGGTTPAGDWLLVNVAPDWASLAIMRGRDLIFFRTRSADGEGTLADLVHQTAMYYEDRLSGAGFSRVLVCGGGTETAEAPLLGRSIAERLGLQVETIDPSRAATFADRIGSSGALRDALTPLVGIILRAEEAA